MRSPRAKHLSLLITAALLALGGSTACQAGGPKDGEIIQSEKTKFKFEVFVKGLESPWALVKLPDGRFLVTERKGTLRVIQDGKLLPDPVGGVPEVFARGQGGLLDLELHPDFAKNGWIYVSFSDVKEGKSHTRIIRARLKDNQLVDQEDIFNAPIEQYTGASNHFGIRMEFDKDNFLFFSIGERTAKEKSQDVTMAQGKVHRLTDDGKVPKDNPFVTQGGAAPSVWSYGHRNGQGMRFQPGTGVLWETEHGPRGGDELNIVKKGLNYGWPVVTYGIDYSGKIISDKQEAPGMEGPVIHWTPSIAVCGIDFYAGDKFPAWKGDLFVGALAHQKLVRVEIEGNKVTHQEMLVNGSGRIRDVRCFDDGFIYLVYDGPGQIARLVPVE